MIDILLFEVTQPIGTFYYGKISSNDLLKFSFPSPRDSSGGIQRRLRQERLKEISIYCTDPDATFPTPIILSIEEELNSKLVDVGNGMYRYSIDFESNAIKAEILDGQHRLKGIQMSGKNIELPIVIMFNLTNEEKAYVFSTINSNQQKVDKSLIYDLFDLSRTRSPYKTCHELARLFNSKDGSPFYGRLKMLEKRDNKMQSLSQGTFVRYVSSLISDSPQKDYIDIKNGIKLENNKPSCPLRYYFVNNQDEVIYLVLSNCFTALKNIFPSEWDNPDSYILTKTVGFGAVIKFLKRNLKTIISEDRDLSLGFFESVFKSLKKTLFDKQMSLSSDFFVSGESNEEELAKIIEEAYLTRDFS